LPTLPRGQSFEQMTDEQLMQVAGGNTSGMTCFPIC